MSPEQIDLPEFRRLGLIDPLIDGLRDLGFKAPSPIQKATIPEALLGRNLAFAATTGSGKTLAYLLPAIQALKAQEALGDQHDHHAAALTKRPRVLVLVPTRELAEQVLSVAKSLSHFAKFRSCMVVGGDDYGKQTRALGGAVDLVVASPGRLLKHREKANFHLSQVTHVIIDEVDTMLVQGFGPDIKKLLGPILFSPQRRDTVQFVLATATMTKAVRRLLDEGELPPCRLLETSDLGQAVESATHRFVSAAGQDKILLLVDQLRSLIQEEHSADEGNFEFNEYKESDEESSGSSRGGGRTVMVFCNTMQSCRAAQHALDEAGIKSAAYHGDMNSAARLDALRAFKASEVPVLVCTDLAARGLDLPSVSEVVMFDFPRNSVDYLHRAGRTARFGKPGLVLSLVTKRDVTLASAIERAVQHGEPLDQLTSDRRDYLPGGQLAAQSPNSKGHMASEAGRIRAAANGKPKRGGGLRGASRAEAPGGRGLGSARGGGAAGKGRGGKQGGRPKRG